MSRSEEKHVASHDIGVPVVRSFICVGVFFGLMLLFNGEAMYKSASQLKYGAAHDFWVAALDPLNKLSKVSGLHNLRYQAEKTVGAWLNQTTEK